MTIENANQVTDAATTYLRELCPPGMESSSSSLQRAPTGAPSVTKPVLPLNGPRTCCAKHSNWRGKRTYELLDRTPGVCAGAQKADSFVAQIKLPVKLN